MSNSGELQKLLDKWNNFAIPLKLIKRKTRITEKRLKCFKKRCKDSDFIKCFDDVLDEIKNSDFLQGKIEQTNSRYSNWKINIDSILERENLWCKIFEGNFSNNKRTFSNRGEDMNLDELTQNETA